MNEDDTDTDERASRRHGEDGREQAADKSGWESVSANPSPSSLGYEASKWERIPVSDDDQVIFLPGNEEDLADDAFIVLDESDLCDVVTRR